MSDTEEPVVETAADELSALANLRMIERLSGDLTYETINREANKVIIEFLNARGHKNLAALYDRLVSEDAG